MWLKPVYMYLGGAVVVAGLAYGASNIWNEYKQQKVTIAQQEQQIKRHWQDRRLLQKAVEESHDTNKEIADKYAELRIAIREAFDDNKEWANTPIPADVVRRLLDFDK